MYREFARRVGRHRLGEDEFRSRLRVDEEILMRNSAAVLFETEPKVRGLVRSEDFVPVEPDHVRNLDGRSGWGLEESLE